MENNLSPNPSPETSEVQQPQPVPPVPEEEVLSPAPARSKKWLILGGLVFVFLAAAAFLGARLLRPPVEASGFERGPMLVASGGKGGGGHKSVSLDLTPAKELPQGKAAVAGIFVRREDQSIFIGTGNIRMMISKGSGGESNSSSSYDGPVMEVVMTHETKIYQDITDMNPGDLDTQNGGTVKMQQVVKPGSLDDLGKNSTVSVWGDKQGDRYIAKVIAFR